MLTGEPPRTLSDSARLVREERANPPSTGSTVGHRHGRRRRDADDRPECPADDRAALAALEGPRLVVLMLNNRELSYVTWEQGAMEGDPKFPASQDIPDLPYAQIAQLMGIKGIRIDQPEAIGPAWDEALSADRPVLIEAVTDPTVPTLPPELTPAQIDKITSALSRSDPDADAVAERLKQEGHPVGAQPKVERLS